MKKKFLSLALGFIIFLSVITTSKASVFSRDMVYDSLHDLSWMENTVNKRDYDSVIVVNKDSLSSDGLSASGLAGASNGVICPVNNDASDSVRVGDIASEANGNTIYLIGGKNVLSPKLKIQLEEWGYDCISIQGKNRIETSYKVMEEIEKLTESINEVAVARAYKGDADAVNISYVAKERKMPIILSNGSGVSYNTNNITSYAIGGNRVLSDKFVKNIKAIRLGGDNRYLTNKKVLQYFGYSNKREYTLVSGYDFGAAIVESCSIDGSPVVLIDEGSNKDILKGASEITFVYKRGNNISSRLYTECINVANGISNREVTLSEAKNILKRRFGSSIFFDYEYAQYDNYLMALGTDKYNYYKNNYYIFYVYDDLGNASDSNILVRKSDGKIFEFSPGMSKPVEYR